MLPPSHGPFNGDGCLMTADGICRINPRSPLPLSLALCRNLSNAPATRHGADEANHSLHPGSTRCHVASGSALKKHLDECPRPNPCLQSSCGKFVILNGLRPGQDSIPLPTPKHARCPSIGPHPSHCPCSALGLIIFRNLQRTRLQLHQVPSPPYRAYDYSAASYGHPAWPFSPPLVTLCFVSLGFSFRISS